ncbi:MAG TPA: hypothetical protein VKQ06_07465 [Gammaproteobacteria bacterium]|nr:hypothetical protein [Gammaproteobacteria bacterium]
MGFLEWLQNTPLAIFVAETLWAYPLLETLHTLGMAMLLGALGLINLRVLGYKPALSLIGTKDLLPVAWIGFTINAVSGLLLFTSDAVSFFSSNTFRVKITLIALAGINAAILSRRIYAEAGGAVSAGGGDTPNKLLAGSSLVFWVVAVICGRIYAYYPFYSF